MVLEDAGCNLLACGVIDVDTLVLAMANGNIAERRLLGVGDGNDAAAYGEVAGFAEHEACTRYGFGGDNDFPGVGNVGFEVALEDGGKILTCFECAQRLLDGLAFAFGYHAQSGGGHVAGQAEGDFVFFFFLFSLQVVGIFLAGLGLCHAAGGELGNFAVAQQVQVDPAVGGGVGNGIACHFGFTGSGCIECCGSLGCCCGFGGKSEGYGGGVVDVARDVGHFKACAGFAFEFGIYHERSAGIFEDAAASAGLCCHRVGFDGAVAGG